MQLVLASQRRLNSAEPNFNALRSADIIVDLRVAEVSRDVVSLIELLLNMPVLTSVARSQSGDQLSGHGQRVITKRHTDRDWHFERG